MQLKNLTIIIPSFNRPKELQKQIPFWGNTDANVIILDGSETSLTIEKPLPENISYHYLPISLNERIAYSHSLVKTRFVVILADDEIFLPSALNDSIKFLENNPDYSSCKGLCVSFRKNYFSSQLEGNFEYPDLRNHVIKSNTPCKRVTEHLTDYKTASVYAVHRQDVYKKICEVFSLGRHYSAAASYEIQISIVVAWIGKIKVLDQLMWLRNVENPSTSWDNTLLAPWVWIKDPKYSKEIEQFANDFEEVFSNNPDIKVCVQKALNIYGTKFDKIKKRNFIKSFKLFISKLWLLLNEPIKCMIRPIFRY